MSLDWQKDDEVDWDDPLQPEEEPQEPRRRRPWGLVLLLVLLTTAVFIIVREVTQRVETATESVEDELLASVKVIQDAAVDADRALFSAFLSGRDAEWAQANEMLVAEEMYLQRPVFGLQWLAEEPETAVISTTLSSDLRSAEVLLEYDYELDVGNGLTDTIALQQTAVYRLGENKWLLAPPEPEFWGEEKSLETGALTVIYPERDEAIVRQLAADWAAEWAGVCTLFGESCDREFRLTVDMSTDPASLIDENGEFDETAVVYLPTPSLVGLPSDRNGYGVLYRGYLAQILRPFWQTFVHKECCGGEQLYNAAVRQVWREISGWPAGDTAVDWQVIQQNKITLQDANRLWSRAEPTVENQQLAAAIVTFLAVERGIPPVQILHSLADPQVGTLVSYLDDYFGESLSPELWEREWTQFVQQRAGVEASSDLPQQDLLMLCRPDWGRKLALYRHDLQQGTTELVQDFNYQYNDGFMMALPDDSGIAMSGIGNDNRADAFLLQKNVRFDVQPDRETSLRPYMVNSSGNYVLWYQFGDPPVDEKVYTILDVTACLDAHDCQVQMDDVYPVWSPDGERMIGTRFSVPFLTGLNVEYLLTLRSGDGDEFMRALGFGASPVWLDDHRYAYVQTLDNGRFQLFAAESDQEVKPELLLGAEDIAQVLPNADTPVFVDFIFRDPHHADRLFLMLRIRTFDQFDRTLLAYDLETGELEIRWTLGEAVRHPGVYKLSPDGDWLLTSSILPGDPPMTDIHLHHLQSGATITLTMGSASRWPNLLYADWSANSDWVSYPQNGMIELFAPNTGDTHVVAADALYCTNAVWTNE